MNIFSKVEFLLKKPKVIVIANHDQLSVSGAVKKVLRNHFNIDKDLLVLETDLKNLKSFKFYLKNSSLPILVVNRKDHIEKLTKAIPGHGFLVLNSDSETIKTVNETGFKEITFGFQENSDFKASDINKLEDGTNFKINYKGNIVPVWLEKSSGKEEIYAALAAAAVGFILDLNLVEVSQALKNQKMLD